MSGSTSDGVAPGVGRRLYRALVFALFVGVVGAGLAVMPGLFVQSIFIGNAQRCAAAQRTDIAVTGEIQTDCAENLQATPEWLPPTIVVGGGIIGMAGGFGYGFATSSAGAARRREPERSWLPF
jgi:hypothetical protein